MNNTNTFLNKNKQYNLTGYKKDIPKKQYAEILYTKFHNLPKNDLTNIFVEELYTTKKAAQTYISICAKNLNLQLNKPYKTRIRDIPNLKKQKAYDIFTSNPTLNRKQMIDLLTDKLQITNNSAATHVSMCIKRYIEDNKHKNCTHNTIKV